MNNHSEFNKRKEYSFISYYLCLLALPMIIGLGVIIVQFQLVYRTAQEQKLEVLNHAIALSEKETLHNIEQTMELLVASDRIKPLDQSNESRDFYRRLWNEQTRLLPIVETIFFADSNSLWLSTKPHTNRKDPRSRPWFKAARLHPNQSVWALPYDDAFTQKKTITISYAMATSPPLSLQRVLGIDLDLQEWAAKVAAMAEGDNAIRHLMIDRTSGQIILHTNPSVIGTELMQPWRPLLVGQSGSFFAEGTEDDGGYYVAYEALGNDSNWLSISVQLHRDTFMQRQLILILAILIFSGCLFIALALLFRQRLAGIIDSLVLMVRQLRLSPDREALVLPTIPGFTTLNAEMSLVSDHLQKNIKQANLDGLTGLYNRRYLNETLARLQGQQASIVLALVDLDHFKAINDNFGHALGDTVLCRTASLGLESLGGNATLYRYGGEELVAIFEQDSLEEAELLLERWRLDVAKASWREEHLTVTFSAGIGASEGRTVEMLLEAVDQALYRAKRDGRNRVYRAK